MPVVLLIDAYAPFREAMDFCLPEFGYDVLTAADLDAAEEVAAAVRIDVVLLGLSQPYRAGFAAAGAVFAAPRLAGVPVVVLGWPVDAGLQAWARAAGAAAVVPKPFFWPDLLGVLQRVTGAGDTEPPGVHEAVLPVAWPGDYAQR